MDEARGHCAFAVLELARDPADADTRRMDKNENESSAQRAQSTRKPWVTPVLENLSVSDQTMGGGITGILENGFYHT